jgi:acetyl-CoA acetyltransferase
LHQHLSEAASLDGFGAALASQRAFKAAGVIRSDIDYAAIYDSFTITLALLLEEIGFCAPGQAGLDAAAGRFTYDGDLPLNTHGGLLAYGHCGVAGGMSHMVEAYRQLTGTAEGILCKAPPTTAFVHADGGVMSAHVSLVLERTH